MLQLPRLPTYGRAVVSRSLTLRQRPRQRAAGPGNLVANAGLPDGELYCDRRYAVPSCLQLAGVPLISIM